MKKKILILLLSIPFLILGWHCHLDIAAADVERRYALATSKFIDVAGMRVHYTDEGSGKETVVLLHGTGASLHTWQGWMPKLMAEYRVIRLDLPAFGLTGPSVERNYSWQAYVKFLEKFFTAVNIKKFHLVGNSLGGQIAWHYAAEHSTEIIKLILIDSAGLPRLKAIPMPIQLARMPVIGKLGRYITPKFLAHNSLKEVYFDRKKITPDIIDRYFTMTLRAGNRQGFIDRAEQIENDTGAGLEKIRVPVLIQWGRWDQWIPVEQAENFKKRLADAKAIIYDNAGHIPHEEIADQTVADAIDFLR